MTKKGILLMFALLVMFTFSFTVSAEGASQVDSGTFGENLTWTLDTEGTLIISGTGRMPDVTYDIDEDTSMTDLTPWQLSEGNEIKNVVIRSGVTNIGRGVFRHHDDMESITIPDTLSDLSDFTYVTCPFQNIYVQAANKYYTSIDGVLFDKTGTNLLKYPGARPDSYYRVPEGVTCISRAAFQSSMYLSSLLLPSSLTTIGEKAFESCSFSNMIIPEHVESVCINAFDGCNGLRSIYFTGDAPDIILPGKVDIYSPFRDTWKGGLTCYYFENNTSWTETIQNDYGENTTWESMDDTHFVWLLGSGNDKSFNMGICGKHLWWKCYEDVLTIYGSGEMFDWYETEYDSFQYAPWFDGGTASFKKVVICPGVTSIGDLAFFSCRKVVNISIPDSVKRIGKRAFALTALTELSIPDPVTDIGEYAFRYCESLERVQLPRNLTALAEGLFLHCDKLKEAAVPEKVTRIGDSAFEGCVSLASIDLPEKVTEIGSYAFRNCGKLTAVNLPVDLDEIKKSSFSYCSSLKEIRIPDGVTCIQTNAFSYCGSLTEITIPDNVTRIEDDAFSSCEKLRQIHLGQGLEYIGSGSFNRCRALTELELPDSVTHIHSEAFSICDSLSRVTFGNRLMFIGEAAFWQCGSLSEVLLPDSIQEIGDMAFLYCSNLTKVTIGADIQSIGSSAFVNCKSLSEIYFAGDAPEYAFDSYGYHNTFKGVTATGYYPENNETWTEEHRNSYDGNITWKTWTPGVTDLSAYKVTLSEEQYIYDGKAKQPDVTVMDGEKQLAEITDYLVEYENNINAGTAAVIITGRYDYKGTIRKTFEISKAGLAVRFPEEMITTQIGAFVDNKLIMERDSDYPDDIVIRYSSSDKKVATVDGGGYVNVIGYGTTTILAEALGNDNINAASASYTLTVNKDVVSLDDYQVTLSDTEYIYDGEEKRPQVAEVTNGHRWLSEGTDFTVDYEENINPGTAHVLITGIGEKEDEIIEGSIEIAFTIKPSQSGGTDDTRKDDTGRDDNNTDDDQKDPSGGDNSKPSGSKSDSSGDDVDATGKSDIPALERPKPALKENVIKASNFIKAYSAKTQSFKLGAKANDGAKLTYSSDNKSITVAGNGQVKVKAKFIGKAIITITASATGRYKKTTRKITVTVNPAKITLSSVKNNKAKTMSLRWNKNTTVTGYEIQYSKNKKFKSGNRSVTVKGAKTVSRAVRSLKKGTTYYVRIRCYKTVSGTKLYSAWSAVKKLKIKK